MDNLEGATPAERQPTLRTAVCWECGEEKRCSEFVVCCTGTVFHVCAECEANLEEADVEETPPAARPPEPKG